jgi:hypothetical protein
MNNIILYLYMVDQDITLQNFSFISLFYNTWLILIYLIIIYVFIFFIIQSSNVITKYINIWIKSPILLIIIHLFIICILYFFVRLFLPFVTSDISIVFIIIGPMLGILSNYFKPFTILCKQILDGKKSIKEIF